MILESGKAALDQKEKTHFARRLLLRLKQIEEVWNRISAYRFDGPINFFSGGGVVALLIA
jgi:hypothetical protein